MHVQAQPLAGATRRTYAGRVGGYLAWLAELDAVTRSRQGDPFAFGHAVTTRCGTTARTWWVTSLSPATHLL